MTWLFYFEFWLCAGIVLLILESIEGSFNYFLPVSLGSFFTGAIVFLFPEMTWKWILFALAFCSVASFIGLKMGLKKTKDRDINDY
jgi:membrane protein implicated in regulation of membrane protease activity